MDAIDIPRVAYDVITLVDRIGDRVSEMTQRAHAWRMARKTEATLAKLTDRELADIGLTRMDIAETAWR